MNTKFKGIYDTSKSVYITNTTGGRGYCKTKQVLDDLIKQNTELKEKLLKLENKYIHNVPCCNEEDCELYKNYQQLKDNWNKLKEYCKNNYYGTTTIGILSKMQEIEGGMNE